MANSLLTIDMITRKGLAILENNLVLSRNINRQYDDSFAVEGAKIGSSLRIRLPDRALVTDGAALQTQDDNEQLKCLAAATLANCCRFARNRQEVRRTGGMEKLVDLLRTSSSPTG